MVETGKKSTLQTIAKMAKVSPGAVSVALSGRQDSTLRLNKETRENIIRLARKMNYRPHAGARAARLRTFHNIGVVAVTPFQSETLTLRTFSSYLINGINDVLLERDYCLSFVRVSLLPVPNTEKWPRILAESRVDGLIVASTAPTQLRSFIDHAGLPAVWVNTNLHEAQDCLYLDNFTSARQATRYLIERGHRRIALIQPASDLHCSQAERYAGYLEEMKAHQLDPYPGHEQLVTDRESDSIIRTLLTRPDRPTAVVNGRRGSCLARIAYELRLRIPEDLSTILWLDDIEQTRLLVPTHTAMLTNEYQLGRLAAQMILEKLAGGSKSLPSQKLPLALYEGQSAAPPAE